MINLVQRSSALAPVQTPVLPNKTDKTQEETVALPIIANLGNQTKIVGDSAAPACGACWVACLAGPQAPICAALCAAMCFSPLAATK